MCTMCAHYFGPRMVNFLMIDQDQTPSIPTGNEKSRGFQLSTWPMSIISLIEEGRRAYLITPTLCCSNMNDQPCLQMELSSLLSRRMTLGCSSIIYHNVISSKLVFRGFSKGFSQCFDGDYLDTWSQVIRPMDVRLVQALDVLHGFIKLTSTILFTMLSRPICVKWMALRMLGTRAMSPNFNSYRVHGTHDSMTFSRRLVLLPWQQICPCSSSLYIYMHLYVDIIITCSCRNDAAVSLSNSFSPSHWTTMARCGIFLALMCLEIPPGLRFTHNKYANDQTDLENCKPV